MTADVQLPRLTGGNTSQLIGCDAASLLGDAARLAIGFVIAINAMIS